jgi:lipase chaperone LimK
LVEESAQWLARFLEPYLQEAAAIGRREAKREAVGLIRDLLDYIVTEPDHPVPRDILRARAYIAAAEADAAEGKP